MKLFKPFTSQKEKRKAEAETFKQILIYGDDIRKLYTDIQEKSKKIFKEIKLAEDRIKDIICIQQKIKLKTDTLGDWNTIYFRDYENCNKSPIGVCVTMLEYGSANLSENDPTNCFYCDKEYE